MASKTGILKVANLSQNLSQDFDFNTVYRLQLVMEESLSGVSRFEDLYNNPNNLQKYFQAINQYYSDRIPWDTYLAVIQQMKILNEQNPLLGQRLMESIQPMQPYFIQSELPTYGRVIQRKDFEELKIKLFGSADKAVSSLSELGIEIQTANTEYQEFWNSVKQHSKTKLKIAQSDFAKQYKIKYEFLFKKIISYLYYHDPKIRFFLQHNDVDLLLNLIQKGFNERISEMPELALLKGFILSVLPSVNELLKDEILFPVEYHQPGRKLIPVIPSKETTYRFVSFLRRLHALWQFVWLSECMSGADLKTKPPNPRRYLVPLLNGGNDIAIEKNNSFAGFIQEIAIQKRQNTSLSDLSEQNHTPLHREYSPINTRSSVYYVTEFGSPDLINDVFIKNKNGVGYKRITLLDIWMQMAPKNIQRVKSNADDINNANVQSVLQGSKYWNWRPKVGDVADFEFVDQSFADWLVQASERNHFHPLEQYLKDNGTGMITDFSVKNAHKLQLISHVERPQNLDQVQNLILRSDFNYFAFQWLCDQGWKDYLTSLNVMQQLYMQFSEHKRWEEFIQILHYLQLEAANSSMVDHWKRLRKKYFTEIMQQELISNYQRLALVHLQDIWNADFNTTLAVAKKLNFTKIDIENYFKNRSAFTKNIIVQLDQIVKLKQAQIEKAEAKAVSKAAPVETKNTKTTSDVAKNDKENKFVADDVKYETILNSIFQVTTQATAKSLQTELQKLIDNKVTFTDKITYLILDYLKNASSHLDRSSYGVMILFQLSAENTLFPIQIFLESKKLAQFILYNQEISVAKGIFRSVYQKYFEMRSGESLNEISVLKPALHSNEISNAVSDLRMLGQNIKSVIKDCRRIYN